ncbi:MAG: YjfK family protein [Pseudomonadota bacterium]|nr:YjfK family protein [Pseudomonadota bacterium]
MGWKDVFSYTKALAANQGVGATVRADDKLPLGARIGSLVQMQVSPVIRAQSGGSLIAMPSDGDTRIVAASQVKIDPGTSLYRLYLVTGDANADEKFLQVFSNDDGSVAEILYCTQLARVIPETEDDQDAYTGVAGYGLGDASYTLWREQLADTLGAAELAAAFGDNDQITFARDAGAPDAAFVPPFTGKEIRIDDAQGMKGLKQQLYFMPYVRELAGGGREYLLITTEIIDSVDGDTSKRGIHVDFVIAIPIEQQRITVQ